MPLHLHHHFLTANVSKSTARIDQSCLMRCLTGNKDFPLNEEHQSAVRCTLSSSSSLVINL